MLLEWRPASAPSATIHRAACCTPTARNSSASDTPVHSLQLARPWLFCALSPGLPACSRPLLPAHSTKYIRDTDGKRRNSSIEKTMGSATSPCTSNWCAPASIVGTPEWCRSKCKDEGVMIPTVSCSGVRLAPVPGVAAAVNKRIERSDAALSPYARRGPPSSRAAPAPAVLTPSRGASAASSPLRFIRAPGRNGYTDRTWPASDLRTQNNSCEIRRGCALAHHGDAH